MTRRWQGIAYVDREGKENMEIKVNRESEFNGREKVCLLIVIRLCVECFLTINVSCIYIVFVVSVCL